MTSIGNESSDNEGATYLPLEAYRIAFETWRYEVDSYWQRNSYFAGFETAALAGCWLVIQYHHHRKIGFIFSTLGLVLSVIWWLTSRAVHKYMRYWWKAIKKSEVKLGLHAQGLDFATRHTGSGRPFGLRPSWLVLTIPLLFAAAWLVMAAYAINFDPLLRNWKY